MMVCALLLACTTGEGIQQPTAPAATVGAAVPAPTPPATYSLQGFDGLYVGTAVSMRRGAFFNCPPELTLKNFRVEDGQVRFGGFRGPIQRDGSVEISNKRVWLTGRFNGTEFRGEFRQYSHPGRREANPADTCLYATALQRHPL
jgi:hypothetical protein